MKRAFMSETAIMRSFLPSIAGVGLFIFVIFVVLTLANASDGDSGMSAGTCAVSAMSPIMIMSSLAGYDNQNGWERYRATLPFSRKDIICARYLCIIVFSVVMACAATLLNILALPFFDHMGIPSTGQTVFEIATASAASMLISLMMVLLAQPIFFRFGHMEALRLSVGLFALRPRQHHHCGDLPARPVVPADVFHVLLGLFQAFGDARFLDAERLELLAEGFARIQRDRIGVGDFLFRHAFQRYGLICAVFQCVFIALWRAVVRTSMNTTLCFSLYRMVPALLA